MVALLIWRYILLLLLIYDVWLVTSKEPTDPVLSGAFNIEYM